MIIRTVRGGPVAVNTYILSSGGHESVIIDPSDAPRIKTLLYNLSLVPKAVLLTHGHFDHIWGLDEIISSYPDIPVYLHPADKDMLTDPQKNMACMVGINDPGYFKFGNTTDITDGQIIKIEDMEFTVIHTPGHTKGGVCYLSGGAMFTGDTLFRGFAGRTDFYNSDHSELLGSLAKLRNYDDFIEIYPGHDKETTLGREKKFNPFLAEVQ